MKEGWEMISEYNENSKIYSAENLICALRLEKKRLISQKKIGQQKTIPALSKKEIPFKIPDNWCWIRLNEISIIQEGPGIRKSQYKNEGVQFLTVTNILNGSIDLEKSKKYISVEEYKSKYRHFRINKGDIVSSCSGATWGKTAIFTLDCKIILNTSTLRLRFYGDLGENKFLYYLTKADFFKSQLSKHLTGQQPNYGYYHYSLIAVPIPPLTEQQNIVSILDEAFTAIDQAKENLQRNLQNAKDLFQSELNSVFSKRGDGWVEKRLGELGTITSSKRIYKSEYVPDGIPFYRTKEIKELSNGKAITLELFISKGRYNEIRKDFGVPKVGDLLISAVGTIGEILVIQDTNEFYFKDGNILWLKDFKTLDTNFLKYALIAFVEVIKSLSIGSAYNALTIEKLIEYRVSVPNSMISQQQIVHQLDSLSAETKKLESLYQQKLNSLEELKKSILQKAFSGELTEKHIII